MSAANQRLREQRNEQAAEARVMREEVLYFVQLSPELAVKVGEITGFDEQMVLKKVGKDFTANGSGALTYRNAMVSRSIKRLRRGPAPENDAEGGDWSPFDRAKGDEFMAALTIKEKSRLEAVYSKVNELDDDEREELKNGLTPSIES
jgi:hypothetical protein